jgi:Spy/CpxP family protein refolding chaperone
VKSGSQADIDRISNNMGPLLAQASAIHTKAFAKFYAILTPDQKSKVDQRLSQRASGRRNWQGHHHSSSQVAPPAGS